MGSIQGFEYFTTKARLSWYGDNNPVQVKLFTYYLSQYTPSVYSEVLIIIDSNDYDDFLNIEKLSIKDRLIEVYFEPNLYHLGTEQDYFSGPFHFCVVNYNTREHPVSDFNVKYENINDGKLILLKCVDPVFYNMQLHEKHESYGKVTISDVVEKIVTRNGGTINMLEPTSYSYNWIQPQQNDYEMIRSLLPYSQASNGNLLYNFFMFNKEAYFSPITNSIKNPYLLYIDNGLNNNGIYYSTDNKFSIEKYGNATDLRITGRGFKNFKSFTPEAMTIQSYMNEDSNIKKQHKGVSTNNLVTSIDDETLQKIYVSNLRHRIYTFNRLISVKSGILNELTPLSCVEVLSQEDGLKKDLDGLYYVLSCKYVYGSNNLNPFQPYMELCLSSELDSKGVESPEGGPLK